MNETIFRKKSMERFSSPEQLNDYIRVTGGGVWMVLLAVAALLGGVCVWGIFGHLDTELTVAARVENGQITCYVRERDILSVAAGMPVRMEEQEYAVETVPEAPAAVSGNTDSYLLHVGGLETGEWVYMVNAGETELADGIYRAGIIVDCVSPVSFVTN